MRRNGIQRVGRSRVGRNGFGELALALIYMLSLGATGCGDSASSSTATGAHLKTLAGVAHVIRDGQETWVPEGDHYPLHTGDLIRTGSGSRAAISDRNHFVFVEALSEIVYEAPARRKADQAPMWVRLAKGVASFVIPENKAKLEGDRFLAETNSVIAAVRGTRFQMAIDPDSKEVRVDLIDGVVDLKSPPGKPGLSPKDVNPKSLVGDEAATASDSGSITVRMRPKQSATVAPEGDGSSVTLETTTTADFQKVKAGIFESTVLMESDPIMHL